MKKLICAAMALMMTATMFVGCGCRNTATDKNGMVTDNTTLAPTIITEPHVTTVPHTVPPTVVPETTDSMIDDITDAAQDFMDGTTDTTATEPQRSAKTPRTAPAR